MHHRGARKKDRGAARRSGACCTRPPLGALRRVAILRASFLTDRAPEKPVESMDKLVSLCKRRGFIFPSSEIYGGLNGAWDYGPLGVELKRNLKQAWWEDMLLNHDETAAPNGAPACIRHGRPRLRSADEREGVGSERARRRLQRPDGRRSRDSRALSRRSARGLRARVRRERRLRQANRRCVVRGSGRGRQDGAWRAARASQETHRVAAEGPRGPNAAPR